MTILYGKTISQFKSVNESLFCLFTNCCMFFMLQSCVNFSFLSQLKVIDINKIVIWNLVAASEMNAVRNGEIDNPSTTTSSFSSNYPASLNHRQRHCQNLMRHQCIIIAVIIIIRLKYHSSRDKQSCLTLKIETLESYNNQFLILFCMNLLLVWCSILLRLSHLDMTILYGKTISQFKSVNESLCSVYLLIVVCFLCYSLA